MYKTIDIADIIGTVVHEFESVSVFPMERIDCVFQKVSLADRFIRLEYSRSALLRVEDLADNDLLLIEDITPNEAFFEDRIKNRYSSENTKIDINK